MKYLNYTLRLLFKILAKTIIYIAILCILFGHFAIGLSIIALFVIAYYNRAYSRGIVYSYTLEHNLYLPRLTNELDLKVVKVFNGWELHSSKYKTKSFIKKLEVSKLKYCLVYWLMWGWIDDDCDRDTVPIGYGRDILRGVHFANFPKWFINRIAKEQNYLETQPHGNSFHLGNDLKANYQPLLSTLWMFRNLAYNFNYSLEEMREDDKNFFYVKFPKLGFHFGYIPYSNSTRKGRMVWFSEDYDKLDKG